MDDEIIDMIDYYDLIEVTWNDGIVRHIPAPFFEKSEIGRKFLFQLPRKKEDRNYMFNCPRCRVNSQFAGYCQPCQEHISDKELEKYSKMHIKRKKNFINSILEKGKIPTTVRKVNYIFHYRYWKEMEKW